MNHTHNNAAHNMIHKVNLVSVSKYVVHKLILELFSKENLIDNNHMSTHVLT